MLTLPGGLPFPLTAAAARPLIPSLAARVETADRLGPVRRVGGADASATRFDPARRVQGAIVTLAADTLRPSAQAGATVAGGLPYVPGLLGFREVPALAEAWQRLAEKPDLLLVDGHGVAHPQGLGVACLLGLVLDVPTIGVAKSLLVGEVDGPLAAEPGAAVPLLWRGRQIGVALRTRRGALPVYLSAGHRIGLATALDWVRRCLRGRRLPEPIRAAHDAAAALRLSGRATLG